MSNHILSSHRVSRSLRMGLLSTTLLLVGGLLLLAGGVWHWHQNAARRSFIAELERKVASIVISEGASTSLLFPAVSEVVAKQAPSATVETTAADTQPGANQEVLGLTSETSSSLPGSGIAPLFGSESTIASPLLNPTKVAGSESVNQTEVEQTQASPVPTNPSDTTAAVAVTAPDNSNVTRPPTDHPTIPMQPASVFRVKSRGEIFNFTPGAASIIAPVGFLSPANKIRIPAIDLVSVVEPLALLNHQGYLLFSIPKEFVGWVPNTGNPGEHSRGWYMGHQPDVFKRLPEVVDLIAEGKTVDIILETQKVAYLYRVTGRPVIVTASEFNGGYFHTNLFASEPEIVLTTCVPPRSLEYRLLVKARLVGQGAVPAAE